MRAASALGAKIKSQAIWRERDSAVRTSPDVTVERIFAAREVYLKGWAGLDDPEKVKLAAEVLVDAGWLRELPSEPGPRGGRPAKRYMVNPRVWGRGDGN
jgi:hypothetical protein